MRIDLSVIGPGVYHLIHEGEVVYVGGSTNLAQRITNWLCCRYFEFDDHEIFPVVDDAEIAALEKAHIIEHQPRHNRAGLVRPYAPSGRWSGDKLGAYQVRVRGQRGSITFCSRLAYMEYLEGETLGKAEIVNLKLFPPLIAVEFYGLLETIGFPAPVSKRANGKSHFYRWRTSDVVEWIREMMPFDDEALRVSRQTLYRMFNDGELKSKKVRGRRLVSHVELARLVGGEA